MAGTPSTPMGLEPPQPVDWAGPTQQAQALFKQTNDAMKHMQNVLGVLKSLATKADTVQMKDIIDGAGRLVASGAVTAKQMAGILATVPANGGGAALAAWVKAAEQKELAAMQKLQGANELMRHEMGVSALRAMGSKMGFEPMAQGPGEATPGTPLTTLGGDQGGTQAQAPAPPQMEGPALG